MSWLDALKKQVLESMTHAGPPDGAAPTPADADHGGMFDGVVSMVRDQGLAALMKAFDAQGMKEVFASWVGKGANLPISPEQLKQVLGPEMIENLARKFGLPVGQASALLSQVLPGLVDQMTPDGNIEVTPEPEPLPGAAPAEF